MILSLGGNQSRACLGLVISSTSVSPVYSIGLKLRPWLSVAGELMHADASGAHSRAARHALRIICLVILPPCLRMVCFHP